MGTEAGADARGVIYGLFFRFSVECVCTLEVYGSETVQRRWDGWVGCQVGYLDDASRAFCDAIADCRLLAMDLLGLTNNKAIARR